MSQEVTPIELATVPLKRRFKVIHALMALAGLSLGFWLYGGARTMCETVNFHISVCLRGLILGVALPLVMAAAWSCIDEDSSGGKPWYFPRSLLIFGAALLIGSIVSECWILRDEVKFATEVSNLTQSVSYSRPRAWPNGAAGLVYVPSEGIHATD